MKPLFTILFVGIVFFTVKGQAVAVQLEKNPRDFYIGLKNYLTIVAENCPCSSLVVTVSNGKISGDNCQFTYETDTATMYSTKDLIKTELKIFRKVGSELTFLQRRYFQLRFVPDPVALFSPTDNDTLRQVRMLWASNATVLKSEVQYFPLDISFRVQQFKVSIVRDNSTILTGFSNTGNWFNKNLLKEFEVLKTGDKVTFYDIYTKGTDGTYRQIKPLTLYISSPK